MQNSIFRSLQKDFLLFYAPSLAIAFILIFNITLSLYIPNNLSLLLLFLIFYLFDTGHSVVTGLRVFRKWDRESALCFLLIPNLLFLSFGLAYFFPVLFFRVYFYWGLFHHIRQYWGLSAWYQKINGRFEPHSKIFCHLLPAIPFLAYHFDPSAKDIGYFFDSREVILYPSLFLYHSIIYFFIVLLVWWFYSEYKSYKKFGFEANRVLSIFCPTLLHTLIFFLSKDILSIAATLIVGHSFTYMCIMAISLQRLSANANIRRSVFYIAATAFLGGILAYGLDSVVEDPSPIQMGPLAYSILIALLSLPTLWHRLVDAYIWKGSHTEAPVIYAPHSL